AVKFHFRIDIAAKDDTTFTTPLYTYMSETDQTYWSLDGGAFPSTGADSATTYAARQTIEYNNPALAGISLADYNVRVLRSIHDPAGVLMPEYGW
ncbi:MAG: hypothetical protein D6706_09605, partial [Chloroflexi bacterium]